MNDYIITVDENGSPSLAHYGVLGMKWGVRHDRKKAYSKAKKKADKLNSKAEKKKQKALKATAHTPSRLMRITDSGVARYDKKMRSINKKNAVAARAQIKADKWVKSMNKVFKDIPLSELED